MAKPTNTPTGAIDPKLADRHGPGDSERADKSVGAGAAKPADKPTVGGVPKRADKPAEALASKADNKHAAKTEAVAAAPAGASQLAATTITAAPPPQVAQALLPMPPLPLPAGVKKMAAPAACAPSGASAKECRALDLQSQALSTKLVELEGKVKQLQSALAGSTGAAAAAQGAKQATPAAAPGAKPAAPAAATKPLTIASGMGDARAASADVPVAAKPGAAAAPDSQGGAKRAETPGTPIAARHAAPAEASKTEAATAKAATAEAAAAEAAAPPPAPVQQRRVLPKLKYKKEKPPEEQSSKLPLIIGGLGVALLAGAGALFYLRRKKSGAPLKIWQGFRKKQGPADAAGDDFREVPTPKSAAPEPAVQS